jgi:hypothetical protein
MTKIPKFKPVLVIGYWNLKFVCNLVLGNRGPARRVGCPKDQFDILQLLWKYAAENLAH